MRESRSMPVPDGLDGMRVDAGVSRLLGLSRTVVATLAEEGSVAVNGAAVGKSDRLSAGSWIEVVLPEPARELTVEAVPVDGMEILYADD
ncbi:MAG: RNA pseudouridine synthase, partial [Rhodococcus sp. (in: high G+C Gram-positive bacteria)]